MDIGWVPMDMSKSSQDGICKGQKQTQDSTCGWERSLRLVVMVVLFEFGEAKDRKFEGHNRTRQDSVPSLGQALLCTKNHGPPLGAFTESAEFARLARTAQVHMEDSPPEKRKRHLHQGAITPQRASSAFPSISASLSVQSPS